MTEGRHHRSHPAHSRTGQFPTHCGRLLHDIRDQYGWTQEYLARRAGIAMMLVRWAEEGHVGTLTVETTMAICDALGTTLGWLATQAEAMSSARDAATAWADTPTEVLYVADTAPRPSQLPVGQQLRQLRVDHGISLEEAAALLWWPAELLNQVEVGQIDVDPVQLRGILSLYLIHGDDALPWLRLLSQPWQNVWQHRV